MQKTVQFLSNISLTLHQLEYYSFHTSNKTYFVQTTPHRHPQIIQIPKPYDANYTANRRLSMNKRTGWPTN